MDIGYSLCCHISDSADSVFLCEEEAVGTIISDSGSLKGSPALCHPWDTLGLRMITVLPCCWFRGPSVSLASWTHERLHKIPSFPLHVRVDPGCSAVSHGSSLTWWRDLLSKTTSTFCSHQGPFYFWGGLQERNKNCGGAESMKASSPRFDSRQPLVEVIAWTVPMPSISSTRLASFPLCPQIWILRIVLSSLSGVMISVTESV